MRLLSCLIAILLAAHVCAAELTGVVVGITDGDTITVLDADKKQHKIRLAAIDAPERRQAFGAKSKQNLSDMAFGKDARLECKKKHRERKICKVWVQPSSCPTCGNTLDVGHAQVIAGLAWWYRAYARDQSPDNQGRYESAEDEARLRKWGLWSDPAPVPPWNWRRPKR